MADTAPPLTEAELDELERLDERAPVPLATSRRVYAMARRALTLESELAQLRREKAEREELYRRRDEWLRAQEPGKGILDHQVTKDGTHWVKLDVFDGEVRTGPTYEAALAAALEKLGKP
jgi:hypothetical protein